LYIALGGVMKNFIMRSCFALFLLSLPLHSQIPSFLLVTDKQKADFLEHSLLKNDYDNAILDGIFDSLAIKSTMSLKASSYFSIIKKHTNHIVGTLSPLSHYIVKLMRKKRDKDINLHRVSIARTIREYAQEHNFTSIHVPHKYVYHIPGRPLVLSDRNYMVLAEKFSLLSEKKNKKILHALPLRMAKQALDELFEVITLVGFEDAHADNVQTMFDDKGNFTGFGLIDLEPLWLQTLKRASRKGRLTKELNKRSARGLELFAPSLGSDTRTYWKAKTANWKRRVGL